MTAPRRHRGSPCLTGLFLLAALLLVPAQRGPAYIMPAEQLLAFMAKNFSEIQTLVMIQSTQPGDERHEAGEDAFMEKIWMKSPDLFRGEVLDRPVGRMIEPDMAYRRLFMTHSRERLRGLLSKMGINLPSVAFTRMDGTIAYRIGGKGPERPKLLIEKERFLPILLTYRSPDRSIPEMIAVQFRDYRKTDQGWYPFEITYSDGRGLTETYTIHTLQANVPMDPALFVVPRIRSRPDQASDQGQMSPEDERLRQIIKRFEERDR